MRESSKEGENEISLPTMCSQCNLLQRATEIETMCEMDGEQMPKCTTCLKQVEGEDNKVCEACKIFWLVKTNSMCKRIEPHLEKESGEVNQGDGEKGSDQETSAASGETEC